MSSSKADRLGAFRNQLALTARWRQEGGPASEHLTLEQHGDRITATAVVTSADDGKPYAAWYQIFLDARWCVKAVSVHRTDSRWFIARSPEPGRWCDGDGGPIDKLDGCRDVALRGSQFTLTPMIRRLNLDAGNAQEHDVFELPLRTLVPARQRQRTTCLAQANRYCIEGLGSGEKQEIQVDENGLIRLGPTNFSRIL